MQSNRALLNAKVQGLQHETPFEVCKTKPGTLKFLTHTCLYIDGMPAILLGPGDCEIAQDDALKLVSSSNFLNLVNALYPGADIGIGPLEGADIKDADDELYTLMSKDEMAIMFEGKVVIFGLIDNISYLFETMSCCEDIVGIFAKNEYSASVTLSVSDNARFLKDRSNENALLLEGAEWLERVIVN